MEIFKIGRRSRCENMERKGCYIHATASYKGKGKARKNQIHLHFCDFTKSLSHNAMYQRLVHNC